METLSCEVLVVGSGPGGASTAALLAEAGMNVLMVEEGAHLPITSAPSYSLAEMNQKYRAGGLTTTFGSPNITYIEGRCVGGASEINAALYHRPLKSTLRDWQLKFQIDDFEPDSLDPYFEAVERDMTVSGWPDGMDPSSAKIKLGADRLGWKSHEVQRFWRYERKPDGTLQHHRQSMTETYVPRGLKAGVRLLPNTRIQRFKHVGNFATEATGTTTEGGEKRPVRIQFQSLFVCAGAVHSPLLLRRSGVTRNVGDSLHLHPMVRIAVRFKDRFNDPSWGVPTWQIEEFKPLITLGGSHSSLPHIAMWMGVVPNKLARLRDWEHTAVFYVAAVGSGSGKVRDLPFIHEPFVTMPVPPVDLALLGEGLYRLGQMAFAAGGVEIFNPIAGGPTIKHPEELSWMRKGLPPGKVNVSTIHLFSSCPMGEDPRTTTVNSHGRLHGFNNVYLNDSSILPLSPAVNPQGTVMAVARRNALRFLADR